MADKETFLNLFVELEKELKAELGDETLTFSQSIMALKNRPGNNIIKQYIDEIDVIRSMRNIFAHERGGEALDLVMPTPKAIKMLEHIVGVLKHPMTVADLVKSQSKTTYWFTSDKKLVDVLEMIASKGIDKFPIFKNDQFITVLTRTGIVNWLADNRTKVVDLSRIAIEDILPYETKAPYEIIAQSTQLYQVLDTFEQTPPPKVLLISKRIDATLMKPYDIVGVITVSDLPRILSLLTNTEIN